MTKLKKSPNVYSKKIRESWVLIREGSDHYIELNDSAGFLWKHLDTPVSLEKLSTLLSKEYDIDIPKASQDAQEFINHLTKEKMIEEIE